MYTHVMEDNALTMNLDESATTTVVVYTDIEDPADEAYSVYYSVDAAAIGRDAVTSADADGVLDLAENDIVGNHELFMGDFGITAAHQTIPGPANDARHGRT